MNLPAAGGGYSTTSYAPYNQASNYGCLGYPTTSFTSSSYGQDSSGLVGSYGLSLGASGTTADTLSSLKPDNRSVIGIVK